MVVAKPATEEQALLTYNRAIVANGRKSWQHALAQIPHMFAARVFPDTVSYNSCISSCARTAWDQILDVLDVGARQSMQSNTITFNANMQACVNHNLWVLALEQAEQFGPQHLRCDSVTYSTQISSYGRASLWASAAHVLASMRNDLQVSILAEGAALSACEKGKQWRQALIVQGRCLQAGLRMNIVIANVLNSAYGVCKHWPGSLSVLEHVHRQNVQTDVITFGSNASACTTVAWEMAMGLLLQMEIFGILADALMCNSCIASCKWSTAAMLLPRMARISVRCSMSSYNSCVDSSAKTSAWPHAFLQVTELEARGLQPDMITVTLAVESEWERALCRKGLWGLVPQSCSGRPLSALIMSQKWQPALDILRRLSLLGARTARTDSLIPQNAALSACERAGAWECAFRLLRWPLRAVHLVSDVVSFSAALTSCAHAIRWADALVLAREMAQERPQPNDVTLNACLNVCDRAVLWLEAHQCFRHFLGTRVPADLITYNTSLSAYAKGGQWQQAGLLLNELRETWLQATLVTYNSAWSAYGKAFQWQQAVSLWYSQENSFRPNSISCEAILASLKTRWQIAWLLLTQNWLASVDFAAAPYEHVMSACLKANQSCKLSQLAETVSHQALLLLKHGHAFASFAMRLCIGEHLQSLRLVRHLFVCAAPRSVNSQFHRDSCSHFVLCHNTRMLEHHV